MKWLWSSKMENDFIVNNNFLTQQNFETIRNEITDTKFQWSFSQYVDHHEEDPTPGQFVHVVYHHHVPRSPFFNSLVPILENKLDVSVLFRIKLNLQPRLPEPFKYSFHSDLDGDFEGVASHWSTAILFINTNNGYTEFENGEKVESVANRLVIFPSNFKHRGVTQTDEQTRIMINFNFLKRKNRD
jgi:hypothetical protein